MSLADLWEDIVGKGITRGLVSSTARASGWKAEGEGEGLRSGADESGW